MATMMEVIAMAGVPSHDSRRGGSTHHRRRLRPMPGRGSLHASADTVGDEREDSMARVDFIQEALVHHERHGSPPLALGWWPLR
jgi:hypothetical protein